MKIQGGTAKLGLAVTTIVATALSPGVAFMIAAKANADPALDNAFVNTLCEGAGICGYPPASVAVGLKICYDLQTPSYTLDVAVADLWTQNPSWTSYQAGFFVGASVAAYCPEYLPARTLV